MLPQALSTRYLFNAELRHVGAHRVLRVRDSLDETLLVVKGVYAPLSSVEAETVQREFRLLKQCQHPRIAPAFDFGITLPDPAFAHLLGHPSAVDVRFVYFTQRYCDGPSLLSRAGKMSGAELRIWFVQALELVDFLHANRLICLDLKSAHFLFCNGRWMLIDLDEARADNPMRAKALHGAMVYVAPEVLAGQGTDSRSDLYSMGVLLYEAITGTLPPFEGETLEEIARWLPGSAVPTFPSSLAVECPDLVAMAGELLERKPALRPESARDVLQRWQSLRRASEQLEASSPAKAATPHTSLFNMPRTLMVQRQELVQGFRAWLLNRSNGEGCRVLRYRSGEGASRFMEELALEEQLAGYFVLRWDRDTVPTGEFSCLERLLGWLNWLAGPSAIDADESSSIALDADLQSEIELRQQGYLRQLLNTAARAQRAVDHRPRLLIADWDAVDAGSRMLLERLLPLIHESGLTLLVAIRTALPDEGAAFGHMNAASLEPLRAASIQTLAEQHLGPGALDEQTLLQLSTVTEGCAVWVCEALAGRYDDPHFDLLSYQPGDAASRLTATLLRLPESARSLVEIASVLDFSFSSALLDHLNSVVNGARVTLDPGAPSGSLLEQLEPAFDQGILEMVREEVQELMRFRQDPLRKSLLNTLGDSVRKSLSAAAAEFLEAQEPTTDQLATASLADSRDARLGRLYAQGGQPGAARAWLARALAVAESHHAWISACSILHQLLETFTARHPGRSKLLLHLAELEYALLRLDRAERACDTGLEEAPGIYEASLRSVLADVRLARGQYQGALEQYQKALVLLHQENEADLQSIAFKYLRLADCYLRLDKPAEARQQLQMLDGISIGSDSRLHVDRVYYAAWLTRKTSSASAPDFSEAIRVLNEARTVAKELDYSSGEIKIATLHAELCRLMGDLPSARHTLEQVISLAATTFQMPREAAALLNLGVVCKDEEKSDDALAHLDRAASLFRRLHNEPSEARALLEIAELLLEQEVPHRAEKYLLRVRTPLDHLPAGHLLHLVYALCNLALKVQLEPSSSFDDKVQELLQITRKKELVDLTLMAVVTGMRSAIKRGEFAQAVRYAAVVAEDTALFQEGRLRKQIHEMASVAYQRMSGVVLVEAPAQPSGSASLQRPQEGWAEKEPMGNVGSWVEQFRRLIAPKHDDNELASALASFIGNLFRGRALILLFSKQGGEILADSGLSPSEQDEVSRDVLRRVRETGNPVICKDVRADRELSRSLSLAKAGVRSVVAWPLRQDSHLVGVLYVDHRNGSAITAPDALVLVESLSQLAGELVAKYQEIEASRVLDSSNFPQVIGNSDVMRKLRYELELASKVMHPETSVLLLGETGVGKSWLTQQLHGRSPYHKGPWISRNAAAFTETLLESELFGYAPQSSIHNANPKGHEGLLSESSKGTFFLDEVGQMSLAFQSKMLTVFSERRYCRMFESQPRKIDCQWIMATNRSLDELVESGSMSVAFRSRIKRNIIHVPSVRERGAADIALLVGEQIRKIRRLAENTVVRLADYLAPSAARFVQQYTWPDNVREIEELFTDFRIQPQILNNEVVGLATLEQALDTKTQKAKNQTAIETLLTKVDEKLSYEQLEKLLTELKSAYIYERVQKNRGNISKTARDMGVKQRKTLYDNCPVLSEDSRRDNEREGGR